MTKLERKEYMKNYYAKNRQRFLDDSKKQRTNNPEYMKQKSIQWNKENKDKIKAYNAEYKNEDKDGKYRVYMLKDNYVGATNNTKRRLNEHRSRRKYTGKFMCVLHTTDCAKDASELEDLLHDMGYKGKNRMNLKYA